MATKSDLYFEMFSRNIGCVSKGQQEKIRATRVLIAGLGALGGAALEALVRLGVQEFFLVDFDTFELTNLNRQRLATLDSMRRPKVHCAAKFAKSINPQCKIKAFKKRLTQQLAAKGCKWADIVLDCMDNPYSRAMLYRAAKSSKKPYVFGSASGQYGMASVFAKKSPDFERLMRLPSYGRSLEESKSALLAQGKCESVLAVAPSIIGALQAQMALGCMLGRKSIAAPDFLIFDASKKSMVSLERLK